MARKRKSSRRRRRGMGNLLTVRRMGGLRGLKKLRSVDPVSMALPILIGGGITALTVMGIRYATVAGESATPTQQKLYRYASAIGLGAGAVASGALYAFAGKSAAAGAAVASALVAAAGFAHDWYSANYPGVQADMLAAMASTTPPRQPMLEPDVEATAGLGSMYSMRRLGAVVPERLNGIVMEPVRGLGASQYAQTDRGGGTEVNLGSVNTGAFGTPGFRV